MTQNIEDGGPAFPIVVDPAHSALESSGMSLRDYVAAAMLPVAAQLGHGRPEDSARYAFQFADAFIAVRSGKRTQSEAALEALQKIHAATDDAIKAVRP